MSNEDIARLKTQIITAFDKAPAKYKLPEGEGHALTIGLNPRDLSKLCVATAPLQHLAVPLSFFPKGLVPKEYMGGQVMGTCCDLSNGTPLVFSGKRLLHCTEEWSDRRVVAVAFTLMEAVSIDSQLDQRLSALGFNIPDSLEVDFYVREIVGPGQPVQLRLDTRTATHTCGKQGNLSKASLPP